ncbi:MAG: methylamine utilization protein [Lysobacterales bacterium]
MTKLVMAVAAFSTQAVFALEVQAMDSSGAPLSLAVVTINGVDIAPVKNSPTVVVEQNGQQFSPQVTIVHPGTSVRFPNRDLTQHHVYSFSQAKTFEIALYGGEEPSPVVMDQPGIIAMGCNIHDWMLGYVYVSPDPLFGLTDKAGTLLLDVDLGAVDKVSVWHPGMSGNAPLEVSDSSRWSEGRIEITLPLPQGNPLDVEQDPLQSHFDGASE